MSGVPRSSRSKKSTHDPLPESSTIALASEQVPTKRKRKRTESDVAPANARASRLDKKTLCSYCGELKSTTGFASHQQKCERKHALAAAAAAASASTFQIHDHTTTQVPDAPSEVDLEAALAFGNPEASPAMDSYLDSLNSALAAHKAAQKDKRKSGKKRPTAPATQRVDSQTTSQPHGSDAAIEIDMDIENDIDTAGTVHDRTQAGSAAAPAPSVPTPAAPNSALPAPAHRPALDELNPDPGELRSNVDRIKVQFHPNAKQDSMTFNDKPTYVDWRHNGIGSEPENQAMGNVHSARFARHSPWMPFPSRLAFEFAELMLDSHMDEKQISTLIKMMHKMKDSRPEDFPFQKADDIKNTWNESRKVHMTQFQHTKIKGKDPTNRFNEQDYEMSYRDLWSWCTETLHNPDLVSKFHWHAERHYVFNEKKSKFERFIDEPWLADAWWNFQSTLPAEGFPMPLLIYSDSTRLSTFGKAKGYPVLVRPLNLDSKTRNGGDDGGAKIVGWLPIIKDDAADKYKGGYVDFKRTIWHTSFYHILESIRYHSQTGCVVMCGDGVERLVFPHILIISADYEEQCIYVLDRGLRGNMPCPTCEVPSGELLELSVDHPLRSQNDLLNLWKKGNSNEDVHPGEFEVLNIMLDEDGDNTEGDSVPPPKTVPEQFKFLGLRCIPNVFWRHGTTDVYQAISWDRLHAYHGGLFSRHIYKELLDVIDAIRPKKKQIKFEQQIDAVPPWKGLNHFPHLLHMDTFADGRKYEDISKVAIIGAHRLLAENERGMALLKVLRSYLELDMYASLRRHTATSLEMAEAELKLFERNLKAYIPFNPKKNWGAAIKVHSHKHMMRDIQMKGATVNFNTKPNEREHRPLKAYYQHHTNFKNVSHQILSINEVDVAAGIIRARIKRSDALVASQAKSKSAALPTVVPVPAPDSGEISQNQEEPGVDEDVVEDAVPLPTRRNNKSKSEFIIGSFTTRYPVSLQAFVDENRLKDPAFYHLLRRITKEVGNQLDKVGHFADDRELHKFTLPSDAKIHVFQYFKMYFTSSITWEKEPTILRAHPMFYGRPRYDFVLVKAPHNEYLFAQLLSLFELTFSGKTTFYQALVLPFDVTVPVGSRPHDRILRMKTVRPRPRKEAVVIDIESIVRGALLVKDVDENAPSDLYTVVDTIDEDFWWRMKTSKFVTNRVAFG